MYASDSVCSFPFYVDFFLSSITDNAFIGLNYVYKTTLNRHVLLKRLYQARKVSGHVYDCVKDIKFAYFYDFSIVCWNLKRTRDADENNQC
jgi:hypothetical protein